MTTLLIILIICSIAFTAYVWWDCAKHQADNCINLARTNKDLKLYSELLNNNLSMARKYLRDEIERLEKLIRKSCHHAKIVYLDCPDGKKKSRCFNCGEYEPKLKADEPKSSQ